MSSTKTTDVTGVKKTNISPLVYGFFKTEIATAVIKMYYTLGINYFDLNRLCQSTRRSERDGIWI